MSFVDVTVTLTNGKVRHFLRVADDSEVLHGFFIVKLPDDAAVMLNTASIESIEIEKYRPENDDV